MKKYEMTYEQAALVLRVGLGLVMFSGGLSKLSKLLAPSAQAAMVNAYLAPSGYINQFFIDYLFSGGFLSPWFFLTSLSTLEFFGGVFLIIGFAVRPVCLIFGLAFWSFIIALPVVNTPGVEVTVKTHTAPALLVMIRDVALSGMMFTLYNLGPGPFSVDKKIFGLSAFHRKTDWDSLGLLLRLSLGVVFIVGGAFHGFSYIKVFAPRWVLLPIGLVLVEGKWAKYAGYASVGVLAWYMLTHLSLDKSLIANLNGIKREFALLAAGIVLCQLGGGDRFTLKEKYTNIKSLFIEAGILKSKEVKV